MSEFAADVAPPSRSPSHPGLARASRFAWYALCAFGLILLLPGLRVGAVFDDWFQAYDAHAALGWWRSLFGLYEFFHADQVQLARESGLLPWWSDDQLSIAFFRPLSSLLLSVDHLWLDGGGLWSHLHALLWYAATVVAAWRVLGLLFGPLEARWSTLLFALSSVHVMPLAFLASLHAHVSAVFALLSFECLIRAARVERVALELGVARASRRRLQLWSALWFLLALLGGESAVVILPIAASYLWAEQGGRRALALLTPQLATTLLFLVLYFSLDYGSHHSGAYLQPGSGELLRAFIPRWFVLVAGLLAGFPPDLWMLGAQPAQVVVGVVALAVGALALRSVLGSSQLELDAAGRRRLLALCAGALFALLPLTSGIPGGRLLILPDVVGAALFGMAARRAAHGWAEGQKRSSLLLGAWVALFGIGLHPLFRSLMPLEMARIGKELPATARGIADRCHGQTTLAVGIPDANAAYLAALFLAMPAGDRPQALHLLSMAPGKHHLSQTASDDFELQIEGTFLALPWSRIYRDTPVPAPLRRSLQGVDVDVLEASASSTRLALHVPTDSPSCWLTLDKGEFVALEPALGKTLDWTPTPRPQ